MNHKFQKLVQEGDINKVRAVFIESLKKRDDGFRREDMLLYAEEHLADLYDVHDGEEMQSDIQRWDKAYADKQKEKLKDNFSRRRVHMVTDYLQEKSFELCRQRKKVGIRCMALLMIVCAGANWVTYKTDVLPVVLMISGIILLNCFK